MTAPLLPRVRLVAGGRILSSQTWSTGLSVDPGPGGISAAALQSLTAAFATAWQTLWASGTTGGLAGYNAAAVDLRTFRGYYYGNGSGPALQEAAVDITPVPGATATNRLPNQTALVVTTLTGLPGRSNRGRGYLPLTAVALNASGMLANQACTDIATAYRNMIRAVNTAAGGGGAGAVIAGLRGNIPITSVRIDNEPDIQRRRADKILASFQATAAV